MIRPCAAAAQDARSAARRSRLEGGPGAHIAAHIGAHILAHILAHIARWKSQISRALD